MISSKSLAFGGLMKTLAIFALIVFSQAVHSNTQSSTYSCEYEAGFYPENFKSSFTLGNEWVNLSATLEGINHFFNFSIFQGSKATYLQYFEGTITNNVSTPIVGTSTLIAEGQEQIYINNFICDYDVTCWTLNCKINR